MLLKAWPDVPIVAFDLETTGKYPLQAEICEIAAVKWKGGQIVEEYQTLVKPIHPMGQEVIAIHNITNEMVADAPQVGVVVPRFHQFCKESLLVAHHAPFDMGFLSVEFEVAQLEFPPYPVLCSAILSRKALPNSPNHRLQTLTKYLGIEAGQAHRALDDAKACLAVTLKCLEVIGARATVAEILEFQKTKLNWKQFSMEALAEKENFGRLIQAIRGGGRVRMVYRGGSRPGQGREVFPLGIVRNPEGDFLVAREPGVDQTKRYFLQNVGEVQLLA